MMTLPEETQYSLSQLRELLKLYNETRNQFYVDTGATYQPILTATEYVGAFFAWIEFNKSQYLVRPK